MCIVTTQTFTTCHCTVIRTNICDEHVENTRLQINQEPCPKTRRRYVMTPPTLPRPSSDPESSFSRSGPGYGGYPDKIPRYDSYRPGPEFDSASDLKGKGKEKQRDRSRTPRPRNKQITNLASPRQKPSSNSYEPVPAMYGFTFDASPPEQPDLPGEGSVLSASCSRPDNGGARPPILMDSSMDSQHDINTSPECIDTESPCDSSTWRAGSSTKRQASDPRLFSSRRKYPHIRPQPQLLVGCSSTTKCSHRVINIYHVERWPLAYRDRADLAALQAFAELSINERARCWDNPKGVENDKHSCDMGTWWEGGGGYKDESGEFNHCNNWGRDHWWHLEGPDDQTGKAGGAFGMVRKLQKRSSFFSYPPPGLAPRAMTKNRPSGANTEMDVDRQRPPPGLGPKLMGRKRPSATFEAGNGMSNDRNDPPPGLCPRAMKKQRPSGTFEADVDMGFDRKENRPRPEPQKQKKQFNRGNGAAMATGNNNSTPANLIKLEDTDSSFSTLIAQARATHKDSSGQKSEVKVENSDVEKDDIEMVASEHVEATTKVET